jgi:hypothetical protein
VSHLTAIRASLTGQLQRLALPGAEQGCKSRDLHDHTRPCLILKELLGSQSYVLCYLAEQGWSDVAAFVHRHGSTAPVGMPILDVRTTLPNICEASRFQESANLRWLEDGESAHRLGDCDVLCANKLRLDPRCAVLQKHLYYLLEVDAELIQGLCLAVRTWKTGNVTHQQAGGRIAFHDCCIILHVPRVAYDDLRGKFQK